jgi:hypothetical protein
MPCHFLLRQLQSFNFVLTGVNPFQSRDAIWHHTFNSVFHMLQFLGAGKGYPSQKKL